MKRHRFTQTVGGLPLDLAGLEPYFELRESRLEGASLTLALRCRQNTGKFLYLKVQLVDAQGEVLAEAPLTIGTSYVGQERTVTTALSRQTLPRAARIVIPPADGEENTDYLTPRPGETEHIQGIPVDTHHYDEHYRTLRKFYRPTSKTYYVVLEAHRDQPVARRYYDAVFYRPDTTPWSGRPEANVTGGLKMGTRAVVKIPISLYQAQLAQTQQIVVEPHETAGTTKPPVQEKEAPWERTALYPVPVEPGVLKRWFRPLGFCYDFTAGALTWQVEIVQVWQSAPRYEALCYDHENRLREKIALVLDVPSTPRRGERGRCTLPAPKLPAGALKRIVVAVSGG